MVFFGNIPFFVQHHITIVSIAFLNRMTISFVLLLLTMTVMTILNPLKQPVTLPVRAEFDMRPAKGAIDLGSIVVGVTIVAYILLR
jgi:SSS family solute:Na+ symporter